MGTRSLTHIYDNNGDILTTMYRQFDGYYEGHGTDLAKLLAGYTIVNGFSPDDRGKRVANGMKCLAATIIAHFKTEIGAIYIYPAGISDVWEDYTYHVKENNGRVHIEAEGYPEDFSGTPEEFIRQHGKEVEA